MAHSIDAIKRTLEGIVGVNHFKSEMDGEEKNQKRFEIGRFLEGERTVSFYNGKSSKKNILAVTGITVYSVLLIWNGII